MATRATIGNMTDYDAKEESFLSYIERFELFVECNEIPDTLKVQTLLTVVGVKTFTLLRNLCLPNKPSSKTYQEIVKLVNEHLFPQPSAIAERHRYRQRKQENHETISKFVEVLRKMATHCDFGTTLNDQLVDGLVAGVKSEAIKQRLLAVCNLKLENARGIATMMETAERDALALAPSIKTVVQHMKVKPQVTRKQNGRGDWRNKSKTATKDQTKPMNEGKMSCTCCGRTNHTFANCRYRSFKCNQCHKTGHLKSMCKSLIGATTNHYVQAAEEDFVAAKLYSIIAEPYKISLEIEQQMLEMEVDTGSAISVINEKTYQQCFGGLQVNPCKLKLQYYTNEVIVPKGCIQVRVFYNNVLYELDLYVVGQEGPPLVGRNWIEILKMNLHDIIPVNNMMQVNGKDKLQTVLKSFPDVFSGKLGTFNKGKMSLMVKEGVTPKYCKPRAVPYALKTKVEMELEKLVHQGILIPVPTSEWATPIVPVLKKNGEVRICGDYKITINPVLKVDRYPVPRIEDLLVSLQGGNKFTKLDLSQAYLQIPLDEKSRPYLTINTHKGLFQYTRMPYGIASAPGMFQRLMEQTLQGITGVIVFLDDVLITGSNDDEHLNNLHTVLSRFQGNGLTIQANKCEYFNKSIAYLGYVLDAEGLHTAADKEKAIVEAPAPKDTTQLRAFLGLVNYYGKFIKNMAMILKPLYNLLQKGIKFQWNRECSQAFSDIKEALVSADVLVHFNPQLPLKLACDASNYGLGAVLSHVLPNGDERPIAYASRSLNKAELAYSQIDKEGLAAVFGVKRFYQYLYANKFILVTDHKPLQAIFGPKKGLPMMAASRLQRYALFLSAFQFDIQFVRSEQNSNADGLSRIPMLELEVEKGSGAEEEATYLNYVEAGEVPICGDQLRKETARDPFLSKILQYVRYGWPQRVDDSLKAYFIRKNELTVERDCIMWGYRLIIPTRLRPRILEELHCSHMGVVKTKSKARAYVWWPKLDGEIETMIKNCKPCAMLQDLPARSILTPWTFPPKPWYRLHLDFLGPFENKMYLVVIDGYSKWLEVMEMPSTNSQTTLTKLREVFARFGLPRQVVTDNGPPFNGKEMDLFMKNNGIQHIFAPPYHPASNGQAENSVKTFKKMVKKNILAAIQQVKMKPNLTITVMDLIQRFLMDNRNVKHCTTGEAPAELLLGHMVRSKLDLLRPDVQEEVRNKQAKSGEYHSGKRVAVFEVGQEVLVKDYRPKQSTWIPAKIKNKINNVYLCQVDGIEGLWKRHAEQIINKGSWEEMPRRDEDADNLAKEDAKQIEVKELDQVVLKEGELEAAETEMVSEGSVTDKRMDVLEVLLPLDNKDIGGNRRYPKRDIKPRERLNL